MAALVSSTDPSSNTGVSLRQIYASLEEDGASVVDLLISTNQAKLVHMTYNVARQTFGSPARRGASMPILTSSVRDIAWCPFKKGTADAVYLCAARSQPLQLFDLLQEEGRGDQGEGWQLRASYLAYSDAGALCEPHAVEWLDGSGARILCGYSDVENEKTIRLFDVLEEGDKAVWSYGPSNRRGPVAVLKGFRSAESTLHHLFVAGYYDTPIVDVLDTRTHTPAAILRDGRAAATGRAGDSSISICHHPQQEYLIYVNGKRACDAVQCWDLRKPLEPITSFAKAGSSPHGGSIAVVAASKEQEKHDGNRNVLCVATSNGLHYYHADIGKRDVDGPFQAALSPSQPNSVSVLAAPTCATPGAASAHTLIAVTADVMRKRDRSDHTNPTEPANKPPAAVAEEEEEMDRLFHSRRSLEHRSAVHVFSL